MCVHIQESQSTENLSTQVYPDSNINTCTKIQSIHKVILFTIFPTGHINLQNLAKYFQVKMLMGSGNESEIFNVMLHVDHSTYSKKISLLTIQI